MISIENVKDFSDMGLEKLKIVKKVLRSAPKGTFVEVGVRRGGTSLMALNADNCNYLIAIDPYVPFNDMQGNPIEMNDQWFEETKKLLEKEANRLNKDIIFYKNTSSEAIGMMKQITNFAYVLLDGEHTKETVQEELDFFIPRMIKGGVILCDNIDWYPEIEFDLWIKPRFDMAYRVF